MLRPIRDDLDLHPASSTASGHPVWTIHDPVRNKFFQIEWRVFEVLSRWHKGTAERVAKAVNLETTLNISAEFVVNVEEFLCSHQLCRIEDLSTTNFVANLKKKNIQSWSIWLLHHYLFFRVPLFKPDKFLTKALPYVLFLYSRAMIWVLVISLLLGLFLVLHQWDIFITELIDLFSIKGLILFGMALIFVKISHEFGHAFTAKLYDCRVPTMGIAFLVLWPMFYTDTNESWKLSSRRKRLNIAAAGVIVELAIAVFATLLWSFMPPGVLREAIFVIATTTWISSVAINASPFMRFDGYYILSDLWGVPNLHERSFRLARWWLRKNLFDLVELPEEEFGSQKNKLLIFFAFSVWIYRFFLFLGIAILVYNFFIKVVGIFLFVVEIWWFILRPLSLELGIWKSQKGEIFSRSRVWVLIGFLTLGIIFLFLPWRTTIIADGMVEVRPYNVVYTKNGGRLENLFVEEGGYVKQGQLLAKLRNPRYIFDHKLVSNKILVQKELQKLATLDRSLKQQTSVIAAKLLRLEAEQGIAQKKIKSLNIYAPISGDVTDITVGLNSMPWLSDGQRLLSIKGNSTFMVSGYIYEEDISRIHKDGTCQFALLNQYDQYYACEIVNVAHSAESILEDQMLASIFGGNISAEYVNDYLIPKTAIYKITAKIVTEKFQLKREALGILKLEADRKNLVERFWRWALGVLIRESGM